jgi:hypothetical protein
LVRSELCLLVSGDPLQRPATQRLQRALSKAGAQCIGCYGPAEGRTTARLITAFASVIDSTIPKRSIAFWMASPIPGQFYRFNLAGSLMKAAVPAWKKA